MLCIFSVFKSISGFCKRPLDEAINRINVCALFISSRVNTSASTDGNVSLHQSKEDTSRMLPPILSLIEMKVLPHWPPDCCVTQCYCRDNIPRGWTKFKPRNLRLSDESQPMYVLLFVFHNKPGRAGVRKLWGARHSFIPFRSAFGC